MAEGKSVVQETPGDSYRYDSEEWVEISIEDLEAAVDDRLRRQGMYRVNEREEPQQLENTQRAQTFSQFFSQLRSECEILFRGLGFTGPSSRQQHARHIHLAQRYYLPVCVTACS